MKNKKKRSQYYKFQYMYSIFERILENFRRALSYDKERIEFLRGSSVLN